MRSSATFAALGSAGFALAALVVAQFAAAPARAEDRCSGTLCDLYYGGPAPETPANPAPRPLTVPSVGVPGGSLLGRMFGGATPAAPAATGGTAAAPATRPMVGVQGGGLVGKLNGQPDDRCSGTLCDLYYGGPSAAEQRAFDDNPAAAGAAAGGTTSATAEPAADRDDTPPPPTRAQRRAAAEVQRCVAAGRDPWQCYR